MGVERVMLTSQRALFDIPSDVAYLNAAGWSPLPRATQEAARAAVARKGQPWKLPDGFQAGQYERARKAAYAPYSRFRVGVAVLAAAMTRAANHLIEHRLGLVDRAVNHAGNKRLLIGLADTLSRHQLAVAEDRNAVRELEYFFQSM